MCGITGLVDISKNKNNINNFNFAKFNNDLIHRGPDHQKVKTYNNILIGSTRLKILDLDDRSNMPLEIEDYIISYNGEIYNFESLKSDLKKEGEIFFTNSDTEVILRLFKKYNLSSFDKLEGMFAIAIFDKKKNTLYLARDIFGIKPLYYYQDEKKFIFCSEIDPILKNFDIDKTLNEFSLYCYLKKGSVCDPYTKYKKINSLLPGNVLILDNLNKLSFQKFNSIKDIILLAESSDKKFNEEILFQEIDKSINLQLRSDVDNSLMLSSGIDSIYILEKLKEKIKKFTISSQEHKNTKFDEIKKLDELNINSEFKFYYKKDELELIRNKDYYLKNLSIDGEQYYLLTKFIKSKNIKVALSGVGGDEIFNSYPSFKFIPKLNFLQKLTPKFLINFNLSNYRLNKIFRLLKSSSFSEIYLEFRSSFSEVEIRKILDKLNNIEQYKKKLIDIYNQNISDISEDSNKIKALELNFYLKDQVLKELDYASMQNSIETRVPYLNKEILFNACLKQKKNSLNKKLILKRSKYLREKKYIKTPFLITDFIEKNFKKLMERKIKNLIN